VLSTLNPEFFSVGLPEKNVYLGGMSILSILLSLELGCHKEDDREHHSNVLILFPASIAASSGDSDGTEKKLGNCAFNTSSHSQVASSSVW
jgi:hypothetical protein